MMFKEWEKYIEEKWRPIKWFNQPKIMSMFDNWKAEREKLIEALEGVKEITDNIRDFTKSPQWAKKAEAALWGVSDIVRAVLAEKEKV